MYNVWNYYEMYDIVDNVIVYEYRLSTNLNYAVKLLTFVNGQFCSEMLAICSLVRIDVLNEKMINNEL